MLLIAIIITLIALIIATITDLKRREVPDYVSYALIFIAFAISIIHSVVEWSYIPITNSILGFVIGLTLAYLMFYLGQWGGGDSKLIMGIGAILGFNAFKIFGEQNYLLLIFLAALIMAGSVYGLIWSIMLAIRNRETFIKNFAIWVQKPKIVFLRRSMLVLVTIMILVILIMPSTRYNTLLILFTAMLYMIFYMWLFVKVIEESCMVREIPVTKLTEGDWIYKNVYIGKKLITGPKDLGVSKEQIEQLKKYSKKGKIKTITIKEGIPFVPAFLIAFIGTVIIFYVGWF